MKGHVYLFLIVCFTVGCGPEVINSSASVDERGAPFEEMNSTDYVYYQGQLFSGVAETTENDRIRNRVEFKDGRKHGLEQWWFENGQLARSFNYQNGELHGLREAWYEDGQPSRKAMYENGRYHDLFESWHENGQMSEGQSLQIVSLSSPHRALQKYIFD